MENYKEIPQNDSEAIHFPHKRYFFELDNGSFYVIFKPQEELVPTEEVVDKSVVFVGDTPYARDQITVKEYYESVGEQAEFYTLQHTNVNFGSKYHMEATERNEDISKWKGHRADTLVTQTPLKPETDLMEFQLEKMRGSTNTEFVVNSNAESIILAARLIVKTYPEVKIGEPLIEADISAIEDYIIAASIDIEGTVLDSLDETRYRCLRALLGYEEDAVYLKDRLEQSKATVKPLNIVQLSDTRISIEENLKRLKDILIHTNENIDGVVEQIKLQESDLVRINDLIQEMESGIFEISDEIVRELNKYVLVHSTDYYPTYNDKSNEWVIQTHSKATGDRVGRLSVHFSIDSIATAAGLPGSGNTWNIKPYVIVIPLGDMIKKNGLMNNLMPADTWWILDPNEQGLRLPENATIVARVSHGKKDMQESLAHRYGNGIKKATMDVSGKEFNEFLEETYGVELGTVGNDTWNDDIKRQKSQSLFDGIRKLNPFMRSARHSGTDEQVFEDRMIRFLNKGLLADNTGLSAEQAIEESRAEIIASLNNRGQYSDKLLPREFARQMVKTGIL